MSTPEEKEVSVAGQRDFPRVELPLEEKETFNCILTTICFQLSVEKKTKGI